MKLLVPGPACASPGSYDHLESEPADGKYSLCILLSIILLLKIKLINLLKICIPKISGYN